MHRWSARLRALWFPRTILFTLDGQLKWQRDFGDMNTRNSFGEGSSPTLSGNMIIVPWDHEGPSALFALDKLTARRCGKRRARNQLAGRHR